MDWLILAFAAHRLSLLWLNDEITREFREKVYAKVPSKVAFGLKCWMCVTVWSAGIVFGLERTTWGHVLNCILALSSGAVMIDKWHSSMGRR